MKQRLQEQQNWLSTVSLVVLAVVAMAMTLHYTRDILIPFVIAVFIGAIFAPVMDVMELRWKFRHSVSVIIALLLIAVVGLIGCLIVANAVQTIVNSSVTYGTKFEELGNSIVERAESLMSFGSDEEGGVDSETDNSEVVPGIAPPAADDQVSAEESQFPAFSDETGVHLIPFERPLVPVTTSLTSPPLTESTRDQSPIELAGHIQPLTDESTDTRISSDEMIPAEPSNTLENLDSLAVDDPVNVTNAQPTIPDIQKPSSDKNSSPGRPMRQFLQSLAPRVAAGAASSLINFFAGMTLTLIFVMFVMAGRNPHVIRKGVYREIDTQIRAYIGAKVALSLSTGLLVWLSLRLLSGLFGYDAGFGQLAFVFGLSAFLLNFIPSVGSIIATMIPLPFALAEVKTLFLADASIGGTDVAWLLAVLIIPGSIQMLIGNVIEPKVLGDGLNLHPITILMALAVWGLLWGPIGMLLAVPMTAIIRIVLMRFEITRPAGRVLAGDLPDFDTEPSAA